MKISQILPYLFSLSAVTLAQNFCDSTGHSGGDKVSVNGNKTGKVGSIDYEQWADGGNNSATFYSDGSFSCSFSNSKDYLCRSGVSFPSARTPSEIGHIKAEFKVTKQNTQNVGYSYVGVYGWTLDSGISGVFEYYIVDNWLSPSRPGDWVGNTKFGDFTIDGGQYTVYKNVKDNLTQYFSLRKTERSCGTIDVTAHFEQWEKLGLKMGKISEIKVLAEAGNGNGGTSGTVDFPYAKVYYGNNVPAGSSPAQGNNAPAQNNNAPAQGNNAPAQGNNAPAQNNNAPAQNNNAPAQNNNAPAQNNNAPAQNNNAPAQNNNAPAQGNNDPAQNNGQGNPWGQPQNNNWQQPQNNGQGNPWEQPQQQNNGQGNPWGQPQNNNWQPPQQQNNGQGNPWGQPQNNNWQQPQNNGQGNPWGQPQNNNWQQPQWAVNNNQGNQGNQGWPWGGNNGNNWQPWRTY